MVKIDASNSKEPIITLSDIQKYLNENQVNDTTVNQLKIQCQKYIQDIIQYQKSVGYYIRQETSSLQGKGSVLQQMVERSKSTNPTITINNRSQSIFSTITGHLFYSAQKDSETGKILQESLKVTKEKQDIYNQWKRFNQSNDKKRIAYTNLTREGYRLIDMIRTELTKETITYHLILTSTDKSIKNYIDTTQVPTDLKISVFELTFDEFIRYTTGSRTLKLNDKGLYAKLAKYKIQDIQLSDINQFINNAKEADKQGRQFNMGQYWEAYRRWTGVYENVPKEIITALNKTATGNQGFWQGGDIGQVQVKANAASVAEISTVITVLTDIKTILQTFINNTKQSTNNKVNQELAKNTYNELQHLQLNLNNLFYKN